MAKANIKKITADLLSDFLAENGFELYNTEFQKEGKDWFLRVYIDRLDGEYISTDDCELVSRFLSGKLDEEDPIEQNYYLEVSSPGMDRQLFTLDHYRRYVGQLVDVKLYTAVGGKKNYQEAVLKAVTDETLTIEPEEGTLLEVPFDKVAKTNLSVVF